jgi:hypothetical protein
MRRRVDIAADDVGALGGKAGIARALEGAQAVRLQLVRLAIRASSRTMAWGPVSGCCSNRF